MNSGPSGFNSAHLTKVVIIGVAAASLLLGSRGAATAVSLSSESIFVRNEFWRLLASPFIFGSTFEVIFGLYLLYYFRIFERRFGTNKFSVFSIFVTLTASLLQAAALPLLPGTSTGVQNSNLSLSPGPYALIFASFVPFWFDIPVTTRFTLFSVAFSDKAFVYLGGLQILLSSGRQSLIPGVAGVVAGLLYRTNVLGVRTAKFPASVSSVVHRLLGPLLCPPPSPQPNLQRAGAASRVPPGGVGSPSSHAMGLENASAPMLPLQETVIPNPEAIATLEAMGFDREVAMRALAQSRNDVASATNMLLEFHGQR